MIVYGFHPVREALRQRPEAVSRVLVSSQSAGRVAEIEALCKADAVSFKQCPPGELDGLAPGVHNGFAAEVSPSAEQTSEINGQDPHLVVLLEDIQDPRNLGAVIRVCEGAGVGQVLIRDRGSAPISPLVSKAAAGATEWVNHQRVTNSATEIQRLKREGYWVYGADAQGVPAWEVDLSGKVLLCLGGEQKGLRSRTRKLCDGLISVPMRGRIESLNVSTAAAALLFEAVRQRHGTVVSATHSG